MHETDFSNYKIGEKDRFGETILRVEDISAEHVVYRTESGVKVQISPDAKDAHDYSDLRPKLLTIRALQTGALKKSEFINAATTTAISQAIRGNKDTALLILGNTEKRIINLRTAYGRLHYLFSCGLIVVANIVTSLILVMSQSAIIDYIPVEYTILFHLATFGSMGGFLSVAMKASELDLDIDAPWHVHFFSGLSRIMISMIAGVFVYLVIKSNLVLGILSSNESIPAMLVISFLAGFSETFVPNILRKIEKNALDEIDPTETKKDQDTQQKPEPQENEKGDDEKPDSSIDDPR